MRLAGTTRNPFADHVARDADAAPDPHHRQFPLVDEARDGSDRDRECSCDLFLTPQEFNIGFILVLERISHKRQ